MRTESNRQRRKASLTAPYNPEIAEIVEWVKLFPPPVRRIPLGFNATFTPAETEQLLRAFVPRGMEDKWFIYFEDGWLRFHRSWTRFFIFGLRLAHRKHGDGVFVAESWVNGDPEQYGADDWVYERRLVRALIDGFLLDKPSVTFPSYDVSTVPPGSLAEHVIRGRQG
ncbi:MAG TPA: hypothetical protein VFV19_07195 [Candidatus Polarisedimenticolaceae bacterium]|nr:hypothetical protein [Candidatus Polarisedimenticolaceae bacterium]